MELVNKDFIVSSILSAFIGVHLRLKNIGGRGGPPHQQKKQKTENRKQKTKAES